MNNTRFKCLFWKNIKLNPVETYKQTKKKTIIEYTRWIESKIRSNIEKWSSCAVLFSDEIWNCQWFLSWNPDNQSQINK